MKDESIFAEALEKRDPAERADYLDLVCNGNPTLRENIESLLAAFDRGKFLEQPAEINDLTHSVPIASEQLGSQIGPYKLLEEIGEGGMGVVYMAAQEIPVRRKVALKIIKPGMDTRQVIARFEAERQALALMEHPNIARVLDAGTTDAGRPYFVMELVKGIHITKYCNNERLTFRDRLQLFTDVCRAVQHAHQRGIIHRDLKPSNVLVTRQDGKALVKVIDFGVAKATGQQLTETTLFTGFTQLIGTPLYMSPEQAALSAVDVDTRSDVYSLGVLLYELLTGTTPFDKEAIAQVAHEEVRRIVREHEPLCPSARISTLKPDTLTTVAGHQQIAPDKLRRQLRGELDWIVMKALEKDRNRRYESASAFAVDIERYLKDIPVEASPPSTLYRVRKFARRNKVSLTTAILFVFVLVLATGISVWQASVAHQARLVAVEDQKRAEISFQRALGAVERLLSRIGERELADVPGTLQLRKSIMEDALEFYEDFQRANPEDAGSRYEAAVTHIRLLPIYADLDGWPEASTALEKALRLLEELHRQYPNNDRFAAGLGEAYLAKARYLELARPTTLKEIEDGSYYQAAELLQFAFDHQPGNERYRANLATAHLGLTPSYMGIGLLDRAEESSRKVIKLCDLKFVARDDILSNAYFWLAHLHDKRGDVPNMVSAAQRAFSLRELSLSTAPHRLGVRNSVVYEAPMYAALLVKGGRIEEACEIHRKAVLYAEQATAENPLNRHYLQLASLARKNCAEFLSEHDADESTLRFAAQLVRQHDQRLSDGFTRRGISHGDLQHSDEAIADFEHAIQLNPKNLSAFNALYKERMRRNEFELAMEVAEKATRFEATEVTDWVARGEQLQFLGQHRQAIEAFSFHLNHNGSNHPGVLKRRAKSSFFEGRFADALKDIADALHDRPSDASTLTSIDPFLVAECPDASFREGLLHQASQLIEVTKRGMDAYVARGSLYTVMGQYADARRDFDAAIEASTSENKPAWYERYQRILSILAAGDHAAYREACAEMLGRFQKSGNRDALRFLAWTCALAPSAIDDHSSVINIIRAQTEGAPHPYLMFETLGAVLYRANQFESAREALIKAEALASQKKVKAVYTWLFLAMTEMRLGHADEAQKWFQKSVTYIDQALQSDQRSGITAIPWNRRLTLKLLKNEAAATINNSSSVHHDSPGQQP